MGEFPQEPLVTRRSRRSTAGNRLQELLAGAQDKADTFEDDSDFEAQDEGDAFDEDFASDSAKTASDEEADAERAVQEEEKREKQTTRSQVEKVTAAANARLRATFNPEGSHATTSKTPTRNKRKVSFAGSPGKRRKKGKGKNDLEIAGERHSSRAHTMQSTTATAIKLKDIARKKATQGPRKRTEERSFTQAELIRRALDNEEGNVAEHRDYLKREEEKRRKARVAKQKLTGPLVRWVSRAEEIVTRIPDPDAPQPPPPPSLPEPQQTHHPHEDPQVYENYPSTSAPPSSALDVSLAELTTSSHHYPYAGYYSAPEPQPSIVSPSSYYKPHVYAQASRSSSYLLSSSQMSPSISTYPSSSNAAPSQAHPPVPPTIEKRERVAKSYLVHELGQGKDATKPRWSETMSAVFGDHVEWTSVKAYTSTRRPTARIRHICPITGRLAPYIDPRTGVPFANVKAYKTLTAVLDHQFSWNKELGAYTG
ncbi:YL1-domain-containing protein [Schizophyllum commune H4-8]|uniref:Vps72/YL1 C-terminal domain-containing protein n=1 Tax=Schizophyllum commune (strain H4-8 / FGSC 9210) TaxID=578458 RepID=D8PX72_SCHCM|nr:YL1-domain-containing protein [Schizophyllum commune H4-8]KAI5896800.1 YL1-domain-containing protein [Schizophyllum commune H4-8]